MFANRSAAQPPTFEFGSSILAAGVNSMGRLIAVAVLMCSSAVSIAQSNESAHPAPAKVIRGREGITLPAPPAVTAEPVTDNYFGTKITDSYRWLEDAKSTQTRDFIQEQNAYTARYLKQARSRSGILEDLDALEHVSRWSLPVERNGSYFFLKRIAGEEQSSIYVRHGWTGKDQRLVDPAAISRDPNTSVTLSAISRDASMIAYGVRQGGADETVVHVLDVKTNKTLEDELPAGLYRSINFTPDGKGLYYARQNREGTTLYLHIFGTRSSRDTLDLWPRIPRRGTRPY